ncbi:MAG: hypothetical protein IJZ83_07310 [Clostridia bacterium]|nr:hypothetical protein [Clostridia bacterium]
MKKIMSLILAVLCITLAALPLSVSADVADNTKVYVPEILTSVKTATNTNNSATPYKTSTASCADGQVNLHTFVNGGSAFMVTPSEYNLTAITEDITLSFEMTSTHYNWASNSEGAATTIGANSENYTWLVFGVGTDNSANVSAAYAWNYCTEMVDENQLSVKVCYNTTSGYHLYWNNTIVATNSKIAEAIITGNDAVIYEFDFDAETKTMTKMTMTLESDRSKMLEFDITDMDIGAGNFAFGLRENYGKTYTTFDGTISNISIIPSNCRSTVIGGQLSDDNTTVRILSAITMEDTELANYASHGFEISRKGSDKGAQTRTSTKVYTSVSAAGDTVTAESKGCNFIGAMTVTGLAAGESYTFVVRAFVTDAAGNKYMSAAEEITIDVPES